MEKWGEKDIGSCPNMTQFVQVSLSKENQNPPDRTCNLQQIALNLRVSGDLSPPQIGTSASCWCAAFDFHLLFPPVCLFISWFNTFFWRWLDICEGKKNPTTPMTSIQKICSWLCLKQPGSSPAVDLCLRKGSDLCKLPLSSALWAFLHPCSVGW